MDCAPQDSTPELFAKREAWYSSGKGGSIDDWEIGEPSLRNAVNPRWNIYDPIASSHAIPSLINRCSPLNLSIARDNKNTEKRPWYESITVYETG